MIWGYHYFWKHPHDIHRSIKNCLLSSWRELQLTLLFTSCPVALDSRTPHLPSLHPIPIHATSTKDVSSGHRNASAASGSCTASADVKAAGFATANKRRASSREHVALREHVTFLKGTNLGPLGVKGRC